MQTAPFANEILIRHFRVDQSGTRRHPLDIARMQLAGVSSRVFMLKTTRQQIRYGFKAPMRMIGSAFGLAGGQIHGTHLVQ